MIYRRSSKKNIEKYIELFKSGCSIAKIANLFHRDRTSIRWHIKKAGIKISLEKKKINKIKKRILIPKPLDEPVIKDGEIINQGKSYKEYLKESRERHEIKRTR